MTLPLFSDLDQIDIALNFLNAQKTNVTNNFPAGDVKTAVLAELNAEIAFFTALQATQISAIESLLGNSGAGGLVIIQELGGSGANGGGFLNHGTWQNVALNTKVYDPLNLCVFDLSTHSWTLQPGKYLVRGSAPAYKVGSMKTRLYRGNNTPATQLVGTSEYGASSLADGVQVRSFVVGILTVAAADDQFILQHWNQADQDVNGSGVAASTGEQEFYGEITMEKIA